MSLIALKFVFAGMFALLLLLSLAWLVTELRAWRRAANSRSENSFATCKSSNRSWREREPQTTRPPLNDGIRPPEREPPLFGG